MLEILCFKLKLGDFRSDHLPDYAKYYLNYEGEKSIERLYQDVKNAAETGFNWYWNEHDKFKNIIPNYFESNKWHYDRHRIKFILWQYENDLRIQNMSGALLNKEQFDSYTIEHISPRNPEDFVHSEQFSKNFLHLAGNLALLTDSQNKRFSNKSFEKKRELFQDTALSSYKEIRVKQKWEEEEITERHNMITNFAKRYFDISQL